MQILIVDTDTAFIQGMERIIAPLGHEVSGLTTGRMAVSWACRRVPDLVFINPVLPDIDADRLIARFHELHPAAGIIAVAAGGCNEMESWIRRQGIIYYMTKPLIHEEVRSIVTHLTDKIQSISYQKGEIE